MFPLKYRIIGGYKYGSKTFYSDHHLGVDYRAINNKLYAPFYGKVIKRFTGVQGGKTIWFKPDNQDVNIRFMHLSEYRKGGIVKEGEIIGITGNTGKYTTGHHLHIDISKKSVQLYNFNNFIDPEKFNWATNTMSKKLIKALEKVTGLELGNKVNDNEEKKVIKKLEAMDAEVRELEKMIDEKNGKLTMKERQRQELLQLGERHREVISTLQSKVGELKADNEELKQLADKNYEALGIIKRLSEAIKLILKF